MKSTTSQENINRWHHSVLGSWRSRERRRVRTLEWGCEGEDAGVTMGCFVSATVGILAIQPKARDNEQPRILANITWRQLRDHPTSSEQPSRNSRIVRMAAPIAFPVQWRGTMDVCHGYAH